MGNKNLRSARKAKNDEFYTMRSDIDKELEHYADQFKDQVVYCNCDDPNTSNFVAYFRDNFERLGLKKLIATHFATEGGAARKLVKTSDGEELTTLSGDGDFRSQECLDLLDECDIIVTNPPFSLFREFVDVIQAH